MLVKSIWADLGVMGQYHAQGVQNVLPCLPHLLLAICRVLPHKAQSVVGKEPGVPLAAVLQLPVHPPDTGQGVLKDGLVLRVVEDIVPDTFHRGTYQFGLGLKVVVDTAHRDPAGSSHRADIDPCPAVLLDKLPADLEDIRF